MAERNITPARAYLLQKHEELLHRKMELQQSNKRLEAQRNELNNSGILLTIY